MARSSTTFRPKWRSGKTTVLRVPELLAPYILEYACALDQSNSLACREPVQLYLRQIEGVDRTKPVNVSKTTHRSPFRYPGGKTWLVPYLRRWIASLPVKPSYFVEPFAGGGICALTSSFEDWADHAVMAELDKRVAAVWLTILMGQSEWLAKRILNFKLSEASVRVALSRENDAASMPLCEQAFLTILRNRVQRGGILAPGAGLVKLGENGRGLRSRWYPETLARRIRDIGSLAAKISFFHTDGFNIIEHFINDQAAVFILDPPYTKAARRLYNCWEFDHEMLFNTMARAKGDFVLTYDDTEEIRDLARRYSFSCTEVAMKNTHHATKTELLIGRRLSGIDSQP